MSNKVFSYSYSKDGKKYGSFTPAELKKLALAGEIDSSCLIWKEGSQNWIPAISLKGLLHQIPTSKTLNVTKFLCSKTGMNEQELIEFSLSSPYRYKTYEIPKRNSGKTRLIAHPSKELKFIQKLIVEYLKDKLIIHNSAYAYRDNIGIKNNAFFHLKTKYLLKMDFKSFFHSITPSLFFYIAKKQGIEILTEDKVILKNFLFWRKNRLLRDNWQEKRRGRLKLSIGAPSSPLISNFIMYFFDEKIEEICNNKGIKYTRYADDLTFSSNEKNVLFEIPNIVIETIKEESV